MCDVVVRLIFFWGAKCFSAKVGVDHDSFVFPYPKDNRVTNISDGDAFQKRFALQCVLDASHRAVSL
tara:strand:+ start:1066 stop:1266 length:201 start_codon:yes stop_codon:yes gene_type:complete